MKTLLRAAALVLCTATAAGAAETPTASKVLAGGPLFTETEENLACFFTNLGTANITPIAQEIFEFGSTTAYTSTSSCTNGSAVAPNQTCYVSATISGTYSAFSCKVTFSSSAASVRGVVQIYDGSFNVLATADLR